MLANLKQTAELLDFFRNNGLKQTFKKGDYVIRPGELPPGVFFIYSGLVKAYDITKYDEENLLIIRKQDEIFPLIWAITGDDRSIIYQALAPTVTYQVDRKTFLTFISSHKDGLVPILDMTIEMYKLHSERILSLEYRTVRERIISFLLNMSQRFGVPLDEGGIKIEVPLRHQDIASSVNASRETTSREISALEKKGLLENKQSLIILRDLPALKKYL
ncbi:MAG TPA: Crp/Fnr family transcriptional regulator [Candidatus Saccharimonadales bacterium]|nr:Crp/Fnr family transcriptional regulator [Candidatus Saccharimonadales bacterium]